MVIFEGVILESSLKFFVYVLNSCLIAFSGVEA